jgi:hypothetical protein
MTFLRTLAVVVTIAGAALAVPALASAETICVNAGVACPAGGEEFGGLQDALNVAAGQDGHDDILLGDKQTPYFGPFVYESAVLSRFNDVTLRGVGGRPSLTAPVGDTVLTMTSGSLEHLELLADFGEGVAATLRGVDMKDVKVTGPGFFAPDTFGVSVTGPATVEDVEITGGFQVGLTANGRGVGGDEVVARGLNFHAGVAIGLEGTDSSQLRVSDSRVNAVDIGVSSIGFVRLNRSVVTTTAPGSVGLLQFNSAEGPFELDHVTVAHVGQPDGTDSALELRAAQPLDSRLHGVAITGYTRGFRRELVNGAPPENVVITDSAWDPSKDQLDQGTGVFVEQRNSHVAPAVVNLTGGDLHLAGGSSAIDRDQLADPAQFTDLEGVGTLDGDGDGIARPDAGAFEFRPVQPEPGTGAGAGAGNGNGTPARDVAGPVLTKLRVVRKPKLRLAFTASEAATVKIVPQRVVRGRAAKARKPIVRRVGAGRGSVALARALRRTGLLKRGTVRLSVIATDAAGNRSAKRVLKLRIS